MSDTQRRPVLFISPSARISSSSVPLNGEDYILRVRQEAQEMPFDISVPNYQRKRKPTSQLIDTTQKKTKRNVSEKETEQDKHKEKEKEKEMEKEKEKENEKENEKEKEKDLKLQKKMEWEKQVVQSYKKLCSEFDLSKNKTSRSSLPKSCETKKWRQLIGNSQPNTDELKLMDHVHSESSFITICNLFNKEQSKQINFNQKIVILNRFSPWLFSFLMILVTPIDSNCSFVMRQLIRTLLPFTKNQNQENQAQIASAQLLITVLDKVFYQGNGIL
ncbi:gem-associated protein [Anaeramoeba flamelloides]|uniref:Gem-associated protein n=1 Tax=Anaeramoeba flamelloides TaxID=1746091 RepID=A0ABQ8Y2X1_9EUKA|nr:gem-associated protein [Anaeramoeba flamelloides]